MKSETDENMTLEEKISIADAKLEKIENDIREIGLPAGQELLRRLELLKIEERALKRNFEESRLRGEPDSIRMEKIEALLQHIEAEESSVEKDADFLTQAAPSSITMAVEAAAKMVDLYQKGLRRVLGEHHPLGTSVFVNHTHDNLTSEYGLQENEKSDGSPIG